MEPLNLANLLAEPAPVCWDRLVASNGALPPAPADGLPEDPLALALPWLVRHLGVAEALAAVMPEEQAGRRAGAAQVLPALQRIGFDARLVKCPIDQLRQAQFPAVLLLRCGDACVLIRSREQRGGPTLLQVVMPGEPPLSFEVPAEELAREYTGMALLVRPLPSAVPPPPSFMITPKAPLARLSDALHAALARSPSKPVGPLRRAAQGLTDGLRLTARLLAALLLPRPVPDFASGGGATEPRGARAWPRWPAHWRRQQQPGA